jgi:hypothetical protein
MSIYKIFPIKDRYFLAGMNIPDAYHANQDGE